MAIGIRVKRAGPRYDEGASKFFGSPTVPRAWVSEFGEDEIFLCQIRLADIAELDEENALPHSGYLYIFLDTSGGEYYPSPVIRYFDGEPEVVIDGFNSAVEGYEAFTEGYLMEFSPVEDDADCTRLFGEVSGWCEDESPLLLQFDPLDNETGFLDRIDGYLYIFLGEDGSLDGARAVVEHS